MWSTTPDGSVIDAQGKVIQFSIERFITDICLGDCCFICGSDAAQKKFNDEHILPEWLLRRYKLFGKTIELPNGAPFRYDRYTVPCCADCNSLMGTMIETPISKVTEGGIDAINDFIVSGQAHKIFVWMGLIFLKTHLKDKRVRYHLDARKGGEVIATDYEWRDLYHLHNVVRCFYSGSKIEREGFGSFCCLPVVGPEFEHPFDFVDLHLAQTLLLRLGNAGMVAVFNDSCGAISCFRNALLSIPRVSALQLREIMVQLAYLNLHLKERPNFYANVDLAAEKCCIGAELPELNLAEMDKSVRGDLLYKAAKYAIPTIRVEGATEAEIVEAIKSGSFSFLFGADGKFNENSWYLSPVQ